MHKGYCKGWEKGFVREMGLDDGRDKGTALFVSRATCETILSMSPHWT